LSRQEKNDAYNLSSVSRNRRHRSRRSTGDSQEDTHAHADPNTHEDACADVYPHPDPDRDPDRYAEPVSDCDTFPHGDDHPAGEPAHRR
jgi:hypothetical protein